ncbi:MULTISPECIES: phosphate ABC transporter permease PstA [unclassified Sulfuricurvum]|uniref:phosphate ABC transporter permease PstA n=1 Tax=unclassified Sulfuricurvum TaxID=2632390 RepID=UPI0002998B3D|nr:MULTISPECIES: phosphate ABC transporter permease PstA [unclassified Sulfuricurvum]OHD83625.1 MAG: phosphate ABC transporter, permease protein PstA [Sulfuricurvum sp. RIFCSPHIGHO2_02_FULL_43_9]OHD86875.1 MAG: phosphate ABC transporter, permease protein PstA [Sulfuricurvum sp. RIFCSPLOWO2_02_43_6]AFV96329.1 phosphate ABC transporter [Candidatus Sulfuricurvum sp. RIFRC-1]OHD89514.1 MAG: phosphate ABC transporter, permease protein PstA [Sulfuricurvum sp. RIFCSPLOWO2_12_FULL_43_24]HBM36907.1 pho
MTAVQKRIIINKLALGFSTLSAVIAIGFLFWILGILMMKGIDALNWNIFIYEGSPPGYEDSGLKHALVGQLILVGLATLIGVPLGIMAGTYLSEYGKNSKLAHTIRDISDIMMSAPSIVIGAFVYAVVVMPMGHFSAWAGAIALAIIMIPIILRTTDDMLQLVPGTLREAAFALGAPKYKVIMDVVYRGAKAGILTGVLLGVARVAGETAPLLFTSFNDNFFTTDLNEAMPSLTVTMFNYAISPYDDWQQLGWAAAFILSMFILGLNIIGRLILLAGKRK